VVVVEVVVVEVALACVCEGGSRTALS